MPSYDNTNSQFGQNIPTPSQQMLDYSYLQNNQNIMDTGQSNLAATLRTAQDNFHRDMASVLQGTMAAGMAMYNVGKSVTDKARERQYQDMLLGGGNYVMQRGFMREAEWNSGLASSDFGRLMKIGGRRPEFMTQEELQFQMQRSWDYRLHDLKVEAGSGLTSVGSSALGFGAQGLIGGGIARQMVGGTLIGGLIAETAGRIYDVGYAERQDYLQNFKKFTDVTDLSAGARQRRLSGDVSNQLADRFYSQEKNPYGLRYIPFVGDFLADRASPDTKASEFIPKMMQAGLFRDQDIKDVNSMEKFVKDTIKVVEKFAALAHTTKDAILGVKAKFNQMGFTDLQQNTMLGNITATSLSTGLDFATVSGYGATFSRMGFNAGYNSSITGQSGLTELAGNKALQEAGLIDRNLDAGSLSIHNTASALQFGKTPVGLVTSLGGGNVAKTAELLDKGLGGGGSAENYTLLQKGFLKLNTDPNKSFSDSVKNISARYGGGYRGYVAVASLLGDGSQESVAQINKGLFGESLARQLAIGGAEQELYKRTNNPSDLRTVDGNILSTSSLFLNTNSNNLIGFTVNNYNDVSKVTAFDTDSSEEYMYSQFNSKYKDKIGKLYHAMVNGDEYGARNIKQEIINSASNDTYITKRGSATSRSMSKDEIERSINLSLKYIDEKEANRNTLMHRMLNPFDHVDIFSPHHRTLSDASKYAANSSKDPLNISKIEVGSEILNRNRGAFNAFENFVKNNTNEASQIYNMLKPHTDEHGNQVYDLLDINSISKLLGNTKDKSDIIDFLRRNGIKRGSELLLSNVLQKSDDSQSTALTNNFVSLHHMSGYKDISFDQFKDANKNYFSQLNQLRSFKNIKDVQNWLKDKKNTDNFAWNAKIASGDSNLSDDLISEITTFSGNQQLWDNFLSSDYMKHPTMTVGGDDVKQQLGLPQDNPNNKAVEALTNACNRLAGAIGGNQ